MRENAKRKKTTNRTSCTYPYQLKYNGKPPTQEKIDPQSTSILMSLTDTNRCQYKTSAITAILLPVT